jgi:hypothetical protein
MSSSESNNESRFLPPTRLIRQIGNPDSRYREYFERGYTRYCTCNKDCSYITNKSEECNKGGDSGNGYMRYYNGIMLNIG